MNKLMSTDILRNGQIMENDGNGGRIMEVQMIIGML